LRPQAALQFLTTHPKGSSLILLAFLLPLTLYLLALGLINRRQHPLLVSGVWDAIGLVFAASGFLFFGGPAIFTSLEERWRMWWLLGQSRSAAASDDTWPLWAILAVAYFVLVVVGVGFFLYRRRHWTAIYHCDPGAVIHSLGDICEGLGLHPVRSGNLFLFGIGVGKAAEAPPASEAIQGPHYRPAAPRGVMTARALQLAQRAGRDLAAQATILEVVPFRVFRHVTLRWDPADSLLRQEIESGLAERLADSDEPPSAVSGWLLLIGSTLLAFLSAAAAALIVFRIVS
jgi:hypothetical protein